MAGGPNAAIAPCLYCAGPSDRTHNDDRFRCRECGSEFLLQFDGPPEKPLWPISKDEAQKIRLFGVLSGRRELVMTSDSFDPPGEIVFPPNKMRWTIGRHPDCDVQILSRALAKTHAELAVEAGELVMRDVASDTKTTIHEGEEIRLADVRVRLNSRSKTS